MPRAVILSGALGSGHDVVSEVVSTSLQAQGWQVRTLDCMGLLGSRGAEIGDRVFRRIVAMPGLYDGLHFAHFRQGTALVRALDREATKRVVPAVQEELAGVGVDLLFATFATGASVAAKLRRSGALRPPPRTVVLCTDVDPYWWWVWEEIDLYMVTSGAAAGAVRRYAPRAEIHVVPPPVRPAFYRAPDQKAARAALGSPGTARCVLLMGGGWGLGPVAEVAEELASEGTHVLAVAGHNDRLRARLEAMRVDTLHPFGFTDRIPELMAASDLVLTAPGATTCSEARVVGRHLVVLDVLPGHGRENLQHELELGDADASGASPTEIRAVVAAALDRIPPSRSRSRRSAEEWPVALAEVLAALGLAGGARRERRAAGAEAAGRPAARQA
ncbi:MAG: glycosyl hydrolase [Acidobacteriota bacterium]|nr:glycosyl hydrolase [Acidobacteriota bacterium]